MEIPHPPSADTERYLERYRDVKPEDRQHDLDYVLGLVRRFRPVDADTRVLEIGTGTGSLLILCGRMGMKCKGLEINPSLRQFAIDLGRRHDVELDIDVGSVEDADLGESRYDLVIAESVFEHVLNWRNGLEGIYRALKPGGVLYFCSTNKFALRSGEYHFPFYGWLPNSWRYKLRIARQGPDIMHFGIDFNQFTHPGLRRAFRKMGFSRVVDRLQLRDPKSLTKPKPWKRAYLALCRWLPFAKWPALIFMSGTEFVCIK